MSQVTCISQRTICGVGSLLPPWLLWTKFGLTSFVAVTFTICLEPFFLIISF